MGIGGCRGESFPSCPAGSTARSSFFVVVGGC